MYAGRFRSADSTQDGQDISFSTIMIPSRGPTPSIFSCYILTEQCVTPPHTQSYSLTHWATCRAVHSHLKPCQSDWDCCCPDKLRQAQLLEYFHLKPVKFWEFLMVLFLKMRFCVCFRHRYSKNNCKSYKPDHWKIIKTTRWVIALSLGPPQHFVLGRWHHRLKEKLVLQMCEWYRGFFLLLLIFFSCITLPIANMHR